MRTGSEMVRGLKENLQAKQAKQKKKKRKKEKKKSASQVSRALPGEESYAGKTVEYVLMPANNDRRFCYIISWSDWYGGP